ncbi:hypothetical protein HPB51_009785 [Rhipicephalus microplus]|uniref:Uncharacterized protein n=1 Tax=Rhipicephalus microplus TaxID=6941 RepID=A0A9J6F1P1_RHIMP|nr:hypothetical protein HPB51_009785 [Rhipicephalus microplus]
MLFTNQPSFRVRLGGPVTIRCSAADPNAECSIVATQESKAERHRGSKKKRKSRDGQHANTSPPPEEAAPAAAGAAVPVGAASESYWKDEPAMVLSSPPIEAANTKAAPQRSSLSPMSKKLAHLYEDEDEAEIMKASRDDELGELSPKVTFLMKSNQEMQPPRLFNVDPKSAAASTAYYERKDRSSESGRAPSAEPAQSAPRIESVVKRTEPALERKGIEFKWKAVKKPLAHAGDSHEEGSVSSDEQRDDVPQPSRGADDKTTASSHEEGSIHSDSEPAKRKKDRSSSRESSPKNEENEGKSKRKLRRRRSRADSESYSSSGRSKSPVRRRRSSRRSADHSDDYSSDRSSVASRGRRHRGSRGGRSSDSSRDDSRRRRYSSEDSREGRRRSRSYSSDTDGSHRRHSPMRRGGYRPYYYNNRGGYYKGNFNNRRYNNYRGGYQNNRYFRGGRGVRRPFRPYYNNRTSPRSYYNSGGGSGSYQRSSYSRDRRSDSETPQDRSFCPPWKRRNPIVSRAPDAEELKKLREAAAQRAQEKQELAAAEGGASTSTQRINKATIIRNWLDDGDSRSPPRERSPRKKEDAPPLPPPLPTDAPPLPEGD